MSWFDSKAVKKMPEEDREWARSVTRDNYTHEMNIAILGKKQRRVRFIFENFIEWNSKKHHEAALGAITFNNPEALKLILKQAKFYPGFYSSEAEKVGLTLFKRAAETSSALFNIVHEFNERQDYLACVRPYKIINELDHDKIKPEIWSDIANTFSDGSDWLKFVINGSTDHLKALLLKEHQPSYGYVRALVEACVKQGSLEKVKTIFGCCPDMALGNIDVLKLAIEKGHSEIADFLLSKMATDGEAQQRLLNAVRNQSIYDATLSGLQKKAIEAAKEQYTLTDDDTLSTTQSLPTMTLTTVFNFTLKQQSQIVEKDGKLAVTVIAFQNLDRDIVEDMRQKLLALGGRSEAPAITIKVKPAA